MGGLQRIFPKRVGENPYIRIFRVIYLVVCPFYRIFACSYEKITTYYHRPVLHGESFCSGAFTLRLAAVSG